MKVYIVHGSRGEYSDRNEWISAIYKNEDAAKARVVVLTEWANEWASVISEVGYLSVKEESEYLLDKRRDKKLSADNFACYGSETVRFWFTEDEVLDYYIDVP